MQKSASMEVPEIEPSWMLRLNLVVLKIQAIISGLIMHTAAISMVLWLDYGMVRTGLTIKKRFMPAGNSPVSLWLADGSYINLVLLLTFELLFRWAIYIRIKGFCSIFEWHPDTFSWSNASIGENPIFSKLKLQIFITGKILFSYLPAFIHILVCKIDKNLK